MGGRGDRKRLETFGAPARGDTLPKLLRDSARRFAHKVALREKDLGIWHDITWADYYHRAGQFGFGLLGLGLEPGERISILSENNPEWLYADLGAQAVGGVVVGIYPTNVSSQVAYIVDHSQSAFVVVGDQEQADKVLDVKDALPFLKRVIVIDPKGMRKYRDPLLLTFEQVLEIGRKELAQDPGQLDRRVDATSPEDTALMVYTSGTTGRPKGAMISHRNAIASAANFLHATPFTPGDVIVSYLPLCHVAERSFSVFYPLVTGGVTVNFAESVDTVQENIREIAPTIFFAVPRIWEKMQANHIMRMRDATRLKRFVDEWAMRLGRAAGAPEGSSPLARRCLAGLAWLLHSHAVKKHLGLNRARLLYSGGAPTPPEVFRFFRSIGLRIRDLYGSTECTGICSVQRGGDRESGTVGPLAPGVQARVEPDGELLFRSDGVFQGYYRDAKATAGAIRDGWYASGDVGELTADGLLKITGRKKDIIITSGGKNISPQEIENEFKASPFVKDAVVIGDGRNYLTALILIEYDVVGKWAEEHRLPYTTFKDLSQKPEVHELIDQVARDVNRMFSRVETIKKFAILDKELDQDDEELTATQKVRRAVIEAKYKEVIDRLYS